MEKHSQIDYFARKLLLSIIFSLILSLYIFRKNITNFNAVYTLYFTITFVVLLIILNEILFRKLIQKRILPHEKAVLITGCDRGFGYGFAKTLGDAGFQVFAGCLRLSDSQISNLNRHPRIHCLQLDVTKSHEVQLALNYVLLHLQKNELWAVINNAGISKGTDIETTSMQKIEEVIDVNLMGTIRVTKAFLPLLRKSKGRVINIASAAGRLLLPGFLPYSISKNAVISFSDGLRLELRKFDVHVISIEPWIYKTRLSDTSRIAKEIEKELQPRTNSSSDEYKDHAAMLKKTAMDLFSWGVSSNLDEVFEVVQDAVMLEYPPYRYSPGKWYLNTVMCVLYFIPKPLVDFIFCNFIFKR